MSIFRKKDKPEDGAALPEQALSPEQLDAVSGGEERRSVAFNLGSHSGGGFAPAPGASDPLSPEDIQALLNQAAEPSGKTPGPKSPA